MKALTAMRTIRKLAEGAILDLHTTPPLYLRRVTTGAVLCTARKGRPCPCSAVIRTDNLRTATEQLQAQLATHGVTP